MVKIKTRATIKPKGESYICVILPFGLKEKLLFCSNAADSFKTAFIENILQSQETQHIPLCTKVGS